MTGKYRIVIRWLITKIRITKKKLSYYPTIFLTQPSQQSWVRDIHIKRIYFYFRLLISYNANIWINITKSFFSFQDSLVSYFSAVAAPEKEARFVIFVVVTHENSKYYNRNKDRIKLQINHILWTPKYFIFALGTGSYKFYSRP